MSEQVLIGGADVGGTSTTVAATDDGARLVGFACAPGGNVRSSRAHWLGLVADFRNSRVYDMIAQGEPRAVV